MAGKATADNSSETRLERRRDARKHAILRAAGAELASCGFNCASLDDIAERVHVTKATLYHYFPSKQALYQAWMELISTEVRERFDTIVESGGTPSERLWQLACRELILITTELPDYARIVVGGVDWPEGFQPRIRELRRSHEQLFRDVIQEGINSGEFVVTDPSVARYCLQGALVYVLECYRPDGRLTPHALGEQVADTVLRMFTKGPK